MHKFHMESRYLFLTLFVTVALIQGCGAPGNSKPQTANPKFEKKVQAAMAKLPTEDRDAAMAQRYCAVENENTLGGMGVPIKVMVEGKPVFVCCASCESEVRAHPDEMLAKVETLNAGQLASKEPHGNSDSKSKP
jgi:hypothetical protein